MKGLILLAIVSLICLLIVDSPTDACLATIPADDLTTTTSTTTTTTTIAPCTSASLLLTPVPIVGNTKFVLSSTASTPVGSSITVQCVADTNPLVLFTTIVIVYNLLSIIPPIPPFPPGATQNSNNIPGGQEITLTCQSDGNYFVTACTGVGPLCFPTNGLIGQNLLGLGQIVCQSFPFPLVG